MNYILNKKLKFYTKESLRMIGMIVIAFSFIIGIVFIKYKPVYSVKIENEQVGYIQNKDLFEKEIEENVISYNAKNVDTVTVRNNPEYELKLVQRVEDTNEEEILVAMQKEMEITYKYYQIALNNEVIESVDRYEDAQNIINELKEENSDLNFTISEIVTQNADEIKTNAIEVAKENILEKVNKKKENTTNSIIGEVHGIKLAVKPISGIISSRYGVSSSIRKSTHTGLDIAASSGTPIKVVADGTVTSATYTGSYGNLVKISHGNGVETWYAHTSKMYVKPGQEVKAGDVIAAVGSTGNSTGAHLHLEIRINGKHVNPQNYIYK